MKTVVFDFDGTIADTMDAVVRIVNGFAHEYGHGKLTPEDVKKMRGKSPRQIISEFRIPFYKIPGIVNRARQELKSQLPSVKPVKGIREALLNLKKKGFLLGILTSNSEENVVAFLLAHKIDFFDFIYSGGSIFGKGAVMKRMLRERKISREDVVYVGDETRDIDAAKKAGIKMIAVSWGFNSKEFLEKNSPNFIVASPAELVKAASSVGTKV